MTRKTVVVLLSFMAILMFTIPAMAADEATDAAPPPALKVGDMLPDDLKAVTLEGATVSLKSALSEKPFTFFQFMTTACSACQGELSAFVNLQMEMPDRFDIVSISMDIMGAPAVNAYEAKFKYGVSYLLDSDFVLPPRFNFPYTPSCFIVDKSGKIVYLKGGFMSSRWAKMKNKIVAVIN